MKKYFVYLLIGGFLFAFTSCGGGESKSEDSSATEEVMDTVEEVIEEVEDAADSVVNEMDEQMEDNPSDEDQPSED